MTLDFGNSWKLFLNFYWAFKSPKRYTKSFSEFKFSVPYSMKCKTLVILGGQNNHAPLKQLENIQAQVSLLSFILQRNKKGKLLFLPLWTFPAIFSKIGRKKQLSDLKVLSNEN
jgi:hypothetical protein